MSRYWRHVKEQRAGLEALAGLIGTTVARGIGGRLARKKPAPPPALGTCIRRGVTLPPAALQRDFVRFCGGDPSRYSGFAPPHLFSQWVLPVALRFAEQLPYAPLAVVNLGCDVRIHKPLPAAGSVEVQCTLSHIDVNDERAKVTLALATLFNKEAYLTCDLYLLARLSRASSGGAKRERQRVLVGAQAVELARHRLQGDAGLEFAQLTGDFNPIHWSATYAKSVGFQRKILHGFGSLSLAVEALVSARLCGDFRAVRRIDSRFLAPLVLPRSVGVFWDNGVLAVGDAPSAPAYMSAQVELA